MHSHHLCTIIISSNLLTSFSHWWSDVVHGLCFFVVCVCVCVSGITLLLYMILCNKTKVTVTIKFKQIRLGVNKIKAFVCSPPKTLFFSRFFERLKFLLVDLFTFTVAKTTHAYHLCNGDIMWQQLHHQAGQAYHHQHSAEWRFGSVSLPVGEHISGQYNR